MTQERYTAINLAEAHAVLAQFHFNDPRVIPRGLRSIERKSEQELVEKRKREMKVENTADTRGYEAMNNIKRVQVALLRCGLANNGLRLVDAHTSKKIRTDGSTQHITTVGFRRLGEGEEIPEIPAEAAEGIRALSTEAVWTLHGWHNPNGVMVMDLVQRRSNALPLHSLVTRNGWIVTVPTIRLLEEEEENMEIGAALLEALKSLRVA